MRSRRWACGLAVVVVALAGAASASEDALPRGFSASQLLERAFNNLYADDYIWRLELATRSRGGQVMRRELQITRKQSVRPGKALVRFLEPPTIRRTC